MKNTKSNYETLDTSGFFSGYTLPISTLRYKGFDNKDILDRRFAIVLIEEGSGLMKINDQPLAYMSPCVLCINESEHVEINNKNTICQVIYFHPSSINVAFNFENIRNMPKEHSVIFEQEAYWIHTFLFRDASYNGYLSIGPITLRRFQSLIASMKEQLELQPSNLWPCKSRSYLIETFFALENIYEKCQVENNTIFENAPILYDAQMSPVLIYIYNNYNKKMTVADMTSRFNMNRTTFTSKLEETVGDSLIVYVNKLRINMSTILLRDTELPISHIMERVGFTDSAHFSRTFRKYTGLTPIDYRIKNFTRCYG